MVARNGTARSTPTPSSTGPYPKVNIHEALCVSAELMTSIRWQISVALELLRIVGITNLFHTVRPCFIRSKQNKTRDITEALEAILSWQRGKYVSIVCAEYPKLLFLKENVRNINWPTTLILGVTPFSPNFFIGVIAPPRQHFPMPCIIMLIQPEICRAQSDLTINDVKEAATVMTNYT